MDIMKANLIRGEGNRPDFNLQLFADINGRELYNSAADSNTIASASNQYHTEHWRLLLSQGWLNGAYRYGFSDWGDYHFGRCEPRTWIDDFHCDSSNGLYSSVVTGVTPMTIYAVYMYFPDGTYMRVKDTPTYRPGYDANDGFGFGYCEGIYDKFIQFQNQWVDLYFWE